MRPGPAGQDSPDDEAVLRLAVEAAVGAGRMVRDRRRSVGIGSLGTKSSVTDLVTEFDHAAEQHVLRTILEHRPDDGVVAEESGTRTGTSGVHWIVDPIDGTTNFVYDLAHWAVSIAAADAEGTIVGVVYAPVLDELFTARRGGGAHLGDGDGRASRPLRCGAVTDPATALLATGFGYLPQRRTAQATRVAGLLGAVRDLRRMGAASLDLCSVAAGRLDAYYEDGLGPWDIAAGELIARESGCRTGTYSGEPVVITTTAARHEVLVANPALFDAIAHLVRAHGID